jgi:3-isopropylmalate/(R)-2-methylmalate dehydratase small subunit
VVVSPAAAERLGPGDDLLVDLAAGRIVNLATEESYPAAPLDPKAVELLEAGGLIPYLKKKYAA